MADTSAAVAAGGSRRETVLFTSAVILISVALIGFFLSQHTKGREQTWITLAHTLSTNLGDIGKVGDQVARGGTPDFLLLSARVEDIDSTVKALNDGDPDAGIAAAPGSVADELAATTAAWQQLDKSAQTVLKGEDAYKKTAAAAAAVVEAIHPAAPDAKGLSDLYQDAAQRLGRGGSSTQQSRAVAQVIRLERISSDAKRVLDTGRDAQVYANALLADLKAFNADNESLIDDNATAAAARAAQDQLSGLSKAVADIGDAAPVLNQMQLAAAEMKSRAANVIATASELEQRLIDSQSRQMILPVIVYVAGALAIIALVAFGVLTLGAARSRALRAEERDTRQQQAILSLLDEITNLADGDLTVDVTVTEDFTGAIADSINYTVQNMRNLVGTITSASDDVTSAASTTQDTALKMSEASSRQAREVTAVAGTIAASAQSLQQVAGRAEQLAEQAQQSVQVAHNGTDTVNRTILGMSALREQIQDTSKRIKRLGESSQEIGNIIEFINDIAEQTNTLALNASIQAAMAGEAGRGFAVVADEVQKLAERAGSATRQIENLVKTIQADTQEAITSMERSTQNVVSGAKSAEEAGQALTKIESSSLDLSQLISEIANSARDQSAAAARITGTMQVIRDIAVQTSGSATQTAQAVGNLNTMSEKLRESVAGFTLPNQAPY
ncbi:methyl-accepting chemotaxis protein [Solimonas marina]|uniref:Methyl-accepting chemotaxis protein n=1 Tax=Solimonas marina TaxID=2714601 RepID=A0A969WED1_9GAMM|nr:methyl-accepting chemotaxis protein [Solimonas marina]NKF24694.1 methyl-accepting chemotaxis protein [Solimonas marina]